MIGVARVGPASRLTGACSWTRRVGPDRPTIGAPNSSNSNRLKELAKELGIKSYLIEDASQLRPDWLVDVNAVGVTAGASAPDVLVQDLVARLQELKDVQVELMVGVEENVRFRLPPELADQAIADQPAAAQ